MPELRVFLASRNAKKLAEMRRILDAHLPGIEVVGLDDVAAYDEPVEDEPTFEGNALLKARAGLRATGLPSLADDSGLCVNALGGDPGVYSARWAGPDKDFKLAMEKVHERLGDSPDHGAYFMCVLALAWPDGECEIYEGQVDGTLVWPPMGADGFGYDPMFMPEDFNRTFGEMTMAEKKKISHRSRAAAKLLEALKSNAAL